MGDPSHPAILLIMGLGGQLTLWLMILSDVGGTQLLCDSF